MKKLILAAVLCSLLPLQAQAWFGENSSILKDPTNAGTLTCKQLNGKPLGLGTIPTAGGVTLKGGYENGKKGVWYIYIIRKKNNEGYEDREIQNIFIPNQEGYCIFNK